MLDKEMYKIMDCMIEGMFIIENTRQILNSLWMIEIDKELGIGYEELYLNLKHQGLI